MRNVLPITVVLLLAASFGRANAQDFSVTGRVTGSEEGAALTGVSVVVKGTQTGTTTNAAGIYRLNASPNSTLVFSFVGYKPQEQAVQNRNTVNVALQADVQSLNEVVVVAYGQQTRRTLTGSAISADQIRSQQIVSATQALQGTAPGVLVVNTSGQPGDNPAIRIRGVGSINASANPLIVVDGVPFQGNINGSTPATSKA